MQLTIEQIEKFLPHRYPFILIDKVIELEKGKKAVAIKNVTANEPFFQGHFPTKKIMPGVLIAEAIAQTGIMLFYDEKIKNSSIYYLGSIKAKFYEPVVPGDTLKIEAVPLKIAGDIGIIDANVFVDGKIVAKGEFTYKVAK